MNYISFFENVATSSWHLMLDASPYILFGIFVGGLLKIFISPEYVANHLGKGRFLSVIKAALFGIPIPLWSCGVLPAAASLKKQGANNGATTAFLISTPESGVDSISITYALLDPIMTVARPLAAFATGVVAGFLENMQNNKKPKIELKTIDACQIDSCCNDTNCSTITLNKHNTFFGKVKCGLIYAVTEIWAELAAWFFVGIILAGLIMVLVPDDIFASYLGGGINSMLLMLIVGIPLYICATASTPIAAALILKGVSPGTALIFLLVGPATNITSISVVVGLLGKRATTLYLVSIIVVSFLCGLALDEVYSSMNISPRALVGQSVEFIPNWVQTASALFLIFISLKPLFNKISFKHSISTKKEN